MKEQLRLLEQLQEIDKQIFQHEQELERHPQEVREIARSLVTTRREISEGREKLAVQEKDLRKKEQDLATEQEKIKRSERRLLGIKNQKEYNALSREIKLGKKVAGELEDSVLTLMTGVEGLKTSLAKMEEEYAENEKRLLEKKAEAEAVTAEAGNALTVLNMEKAKIAESIDRDFLKRYETVRKARGTAIAELLNGSCGACHMAVPPQLNIRVLKQEEMIVCPNCLRILYVKEENIPEANRMDS